MVNPLAGNSKGRMFGVPKRTSVRPCGGGSAPSTDFDWADCAATGNLTLSGTAAVDGVTGYTKVLAWRQTTVEQNGLYSVSPAGVWTKIGQPISVKVLNGSTQGRFWFDLTADDTYQAGCAAYG